MSLIAKLNGQWEGDFDHLRDAIVDNISAMLMSRAPVLGEAELGPLALASIAGFGVINHQQSQGKESADKILADIRGLIMRFEPRLTGVIVELDDVSDEVSNKLKFRIEGAIESKFGSEVVAFDSSIDFTTNNLDVRKTSLV